MPKIVHGPALFKHTRPACPEFTDEARPPKYTSLLVISLHAAAEACGGSGIADAEIPPVKSIAVKSTTLRGAFEKGVEKGIERGRKECIEGMLQNLLMVRLHRDLTQAEEAALSSRASTLDGPRDAVAMLDLDADALLVWLLGPDAE
jgi:hypothetical protein